MTDEELVKALRERADKVGSQDSNTASYLRKASDTIDRLRKKK